MAEIFATLLKTTLVLCIACSRVEPHWKNDHEEKGNTP